MHDYGCAWRILRTSSLTDQIFIKAQRIRTLQQNKTQKVDEGPVISFGRYSLSDENFRKEWKIIERMSIKEIKDKYGEDLRLFNLIRQKGLIFERKLLSETLARISNNQISLKNNNPVDLSASIS